MKNFAKTFYQTMKKDIMTENFTMKEYIIYGVAYPAALVLLMVIAEFL